MRCAFSNGSITVLQCIAATCSNYMLPIMTGLAPAMIAVVTGADGYVALELIKQLLEKVSPKLMALHSSQHGCYHRHDYTSEVQLGWPHQMPS